MSTNNMPPSREDNLDEPFQGHPDEPSPEATVPETQTNDNTPNESDGSVASSQESTLVDQDCKYLRELPLSA